MHGGRGAVMARLQAIGAVRAGLVALMMLPVSGLAQQDGAGEQSAPDYSLPAVVERMQAYQAEAREALEAREAAYAGRLADARQRLDQARNRLAGLETEGGRLEAAFDDNKAELNRKAELLNDKIGALKELLGVFQQNASDLIGAFVTSPTSIQYPDRDVWLEGFANRMRNASEVSSVDDIRALWFEIQREIAASDDIVRLRTEVADPDGSVTERDLVRVGTFNLLDAGADPAYLAWDAGRQQPRVLARQPAGGELERVAGYVAAEQGLHALAVDPTGGTLLELLVEKPTLRERIDQGGLVGYTILFLGALSLLLALVKLADLGLISLRMASQDRDPGQPRADNPLGRLLATWSAHRHDDPETVQMRLHDRVAKETARIERFSVFLVIIAAVAPLMGLLGTVVGMINTFQAITLFGTGDPQTMAGGISQALITTVLGLVVAVPAVLLHALVAARGRALVTVLRQRSAALSGDALAMRHGGVRAAPPSMPAAAPSPA